MRVVVIGIANQQTSLPVDSFPFEYESWRNVNGQIRHTVGGVGFNVARVLSTLGNMVALASPLGEDYPAALIDAEAYRFNISTHLCRRELVRTPRSVVLYDSAGHRMVNSDLTDAASFAFDPEDLLPDVGRSNLVVLANLPLVRSLIAPLRDAANRFAVDLHDLRDPEHQAISEFLAADLINLSNEHLVGREAETLEYLRENSNAELISMTLGAEGALVLTPDMDAPVHVPVRDVEATNTVGAGEVYWAVTLHHFLKEHRSAVDAATFGCEAAARMVELSAPYAPTTIQDLREVIAPNCGAVVPVVEMPWSPYEVASDLPGQPSDWAI